MTTPANLGPHRYLLRVDAPAGAGPLVDRLLAQVSADLTATAPGVTARIDRADAPRKSDLPLLEIDLAARRVFVGDVLVQLADKEFEILRHLVARPGEVVTRDEIVDALGGHGQDRRASRSIDVHVHRIRAKLALCGDCISTVRGLGYRFNDSSSVVVN